MSMGVRRELSVVSILKHFLSLMVLIVAYHANAFENESGLWFGSFGKKQIFEDYSYFAEFQLRYNTNQTEMAQALVRTGVLKSMSDRHELGVLFAYVETGEIKEYRPTLQHLYRFNLEPSVSMGLRSRLEHRDLEKRGDSSLRYRAMVRAEAPIQNNYRFVVADEVFFNLTREPWTGNRSVDRNRFFVGIQKAFAQISLETGYLNQFVFRDSDLSEHLIVVYLLY
jgi:hypothetical protein